MAKGSHENVAFIDVDSYRLDDVIIIDDTECVNKEFQGSNVATERRKSPLYIYVDGCSSDDDACSPSRTFPSSSGRHFVELDGRQSRKHYAFLMGKCRQRNYGKATARNRFGLHIGSHSSSSESDSSDCEVMEGSFEKLQKQWEEASLRRKHDARSAYFTVDDEDKATASHGDDSDTNFDVENQMKQQCEVQVCPSPQTDGNDGSPLLTEIKGISAEKSPITSFDVKDIICERERLKETDEYRRAMEEEWTTRQQQLQIQAEEAQRLRRKRKADRMRLLDMQRRQMKRLEEVRETQKKDEENINLKEQLRVDVRKELSFLEMKCTDMASLLRGLGIHVGSGLHPSSQEVQVAYKRALLKFHPDRVSSTDIRQLVEAEEKFKLISHMKKKFMCVDSDTNFDVENEMKLQSEVVVCSGPENAGDFCWIGFERERLKETDEYRRAMEEEWRTRKQQLQIQAEEARKLRRKRKADRMQLLDMHTRQMKRLEEVRETRKKDEENINLKEQFRVDVRKELRKVEMKCTDMASLLRGLGIQVGTGLHPSSQEIQAAYKKALLKFHPDRVSRTDIRQQVEAEEKFKLISHMKKIVLTK
ncbi:uncharacterized protein LOC111004748 [Momordica charantia]|uniref:Uncharacterized protein LOC111004748 n=1 Tax=Momordica charantia TaxID=3673 RepID=A0A6J1BQR9_MOMCH|nr:uncharacterized protein LOC111004748 [Momordica charantia]